MERKLAILTALLLTAGSVYAACIANGNICYTESGYTLAPTSSAMQPQSKTLAELNALTPTSKGQIYICSDCNDLICVSTGTGTGAFTLVTSSLTVCG